MSDFIEYDSRQENPHAFIQWKGTDVCMDFYCDCGAHCHFDGYFAYAVKCPHCKSVWEMPCFLKPRKLTDFRDRIPKMLEPDEDHSDEMVDANGVMQLVPRSRSSPPSKKEGER